LGGGVIGTADPSTHSVLTGREVGTRFAELHDILSPHVLCNLEIPKQNVGTIPKTRFNFQDWRMLVLS